MTARSLQRQWIHATTHILIADDMPGKLKHMREIVERGNPNAIIHTATSARQAIQKIHALGTGIDTGVIDFDFFGEHQNGSDIVRELRRTNARARITCATAREEGHGFDEATALTLAAGADESLCAVSSDFERRLQAFAA